MPTVIQSTDNILSMGFNGHWRILDITKHNRKFMESLDIAIPEKRMTLKNCKHIPISVINETFPDAFDDA